MKKLVLIALLCLTGSLYSQTGSYLNQEAIKSEAIKIASLIVINNYKEIRKMPHIEYCVNGYIAFNFKDYDERKYFLTLINNDSNFISIKNLFNKEFAEINW